MINSSYFMNGWIIPSNTILEIWDFNTPIVVTSNCICPHCQGEQTVKNGTKRGKQRWLCKDCDRTFTPGGLGHRQSEGDRAMSGAERQRKRRARLRQDSDTNRNTAP